jgi:hypothetical protein
MLCGPGVCGHAIEADVLSVARLPLVLLPYIIAL